MPGRAFPLRRPLQDTVVRFEDWPLIKEAPRQSWGGMNLLVTVEHNGSFEGFEIVEIDLEPDWDGCEPSPIPACLRDYVETQIRGRVEDRDHIREAIANDCPIYLDDERAYDRALNSDVMRA